MGLLTKFPLKTYQPFLTGELRDDIAHSNNLLTIAFKQGGKYNWCNYRNFRTSLNKKIQDPKSNYLNQKLGDLRRGWNVIKDFNGITPQSTPKAIKYNGEDVRRPKI